MIAILAALCVLAIAIIATCIVLAVRWSPKRTPWCPNLARQQLHALYGHYLIDRDEYLRGLAEIAERENMEDAP